MLSLATTFNPSLLDVTNADIAGANICLTMTVRDSGNANILSGAIFAVLLVITCYYQQFTR